MIEKTIIIAVGLLIFNTFMMFINLKKDAKANYALKLGLLGLLFVPDQMNKTGRFFWRFQVILLICYLAAIVILFIMDAVLSS